MVLNSNTDENIAVFQTWYGGILVLVLGCVFLLYPLVVTLMCVGEIMNCIAIDTKKMKWRSQAKRVQEKIIDRKQEYNDYAETKEDEWDCRLAIEHYRNTPNSSSNRVVWALVSKEIYDKYEGQSFINILYDSQNPDVFIVEGE